MKKLLLLLFIFFSTNIDAQWYTKLYGVNNISELDEWQLDMALVDSKNIVSTGVALTLVGIAATTVGTIVYKRGKEENENNPSYYLKDVPNSRMIEGELIIAFGIITDLIGIPLWAVGGSRVRTISFQLTKFNDTSYIPSVGITFYF